MNDHRAALQELNHDIDRLRTNLDGLLMRQDLPNKELIEWASQLVEVIDDCVGKGLNDGE